MKNPSRTYTGKRRRLHESEAGFCAVQVLESTGKIRNLNHVVRHSPDGFEWGYMGSGPSDLALSILSDYFFFDTAKAEEHYVNFKSRFVQHWKATWQISEKEIEEWITAGCRP